jgi:hypothetical protein
MKALFFVCFFFLCVNADINLRHVRGNLQCSTLSSNFPFTPSSVGNDAPMTCNPLSNTYSRLTFDVEVGSEHVDRMEKSFYFTSLPGFGSNSHTTSSDGCVGSPFSGSIYKNECVKLGLPLRTSSGNGYSIFPNVNDKQLARILNISTQDLNYIIEGYEINFSFGWTRWVYDLANAVEHVFPFAYQFRINDTLQAYQETIDNIQSQPITQPVALTRCIPNLLNTSGRLNAVLESCIRTACNCSGNPGKAPGVPDYYTYEVDYISPVGQVRRVLNNGRARLSVDVVVTLNAVIFLKGDIIFQKQMFQKLIYDITSKNPIDTGLGSVGSSSGVENQYLRMYNNKDDIKIGSSELAIDQYQFPAVIQGGALFKLKASLLNAYINNVNTQKNTILGSTSKQSGKTAAPSLAGGYIVDFMKDADVVVSPYRINANSPYNVEGLPLTRCIPPDAFFYVSNAMIRSGVYFANNLRQSCGRMGTSSAAIMLDIANLNNFCCNDTLITGSCLPGFKNGNFPSSEDIFLNCSLFTSLFTPPGWKNYNYYLIGRNLLNLQMPNYATSGLSQTIYGAPTGVFEMVLEVSDILITPLVGNNAFNVNIPPLVATVANDPSLRFFGDDPIGCIYDSQANGRGLFFVQKVCNVGTNGGLANVSIVFDTCQHITYEGISLTSKPLPIVFNPLNNRQCTSDVITIPIVVNPQYVNNITCEAVHLSSTYGATKEVSYKNVKCYDVIGFFTNRTGIVNMTLPKYDCHNCSQFDLACLNYCTTIGDSLPLWYVAFYPIGIIVLALIIGGTVQLVMMSKLREEEEMKFKMD